MIVLNMEQLNLDLNLAKIFVKVVECKSFSEASRVLKTPKSTISRAVSQLESSLGLPLIVRTTRHFNLTQHGEKLFQDSKKLFFEFDMQLNQLLKNKKGLQGIIRLTAPLDLGVALLNPLVLEFSEQNPQIALEVDYSDEVKNIVKENFDLALRIGPQNDSQLKTKKIGESSFILVASPYFIQQHGHLQKVEDIERYPYIHFSRIQQSKVAQLLNGKEKYIIKNKPQISLNHLESIKKLIITSKGLSLLPQFFVQSELQKGTLIHLLKSYKTKAVDISWVMPSHKENSALIKNFKDFIDPRLKSQLD